MRSSTRTDNRGRARIATRAAAALVTLAVGLPAEAGVTLNTLVDRASVGHPSGHEFEISRKDCENTADTIEFSVGVTDVGTRLLEVWLSEDSALDCKLKEARSQTEASHCVRITSLNPQEQTVSVSMTSGEIVAQLEGVTSCADSNSNTAARPITLYFMLVDGSGSAVDAADAQTWETKVDLLGPNPPTDLEAGLGSEILVISYDITSSADVDGFTVYCDPPPGGASSSATGSTSASSTSASSTSASSATSGAGGGDSCSSALLVAGEVPATTLPSCGTAGKSSAKANATGLTNGSTYAVAVSAHDLLGNVGPLSEVVCGTPAEVDDFFETYREAGGKGGGGCSVSPSTFFGVPSAIGLGLAGLVLVARRARSSKR